MWFHGLGARLRAVGQQTLPRMVLRKGFSDAAKGIVKKVLRRVLSRYHLVGFMVKKASQKGSQKASSSGLSSEEGFSEGVLRRALPLHPPSPWDPSPTASLGRPLRRIAKRTRGEEGGRGVGRGFREGSSSCNGGMWGPSKRQLGPDPHQGALNQSDSELFV